MKKLLVVLFSVTVMQQVNAQCPPGASALYTLWIIQTGPTSLDTTCYFTAHNFPANSKVYFYNNSSVLMDSVTTDGTGYGYAQRYSTNCLIYFPPPPAIGTAVSGTCTVNLGFAGLLPIKLKTFSIITTDNRVTAYWQLEEESPGTVYNLQESTNGTDFSNIYTVTNPVLSTPGKQYQYNVPVLLTGKRFYRLKIIENGSVTAYSAIKTATVKDYSGMDIYPTVGNGSYTISIPEKFVNGTVQIFTTTGSIIQNKKIAGPLLKITLNAIAGLYRIKALAPDGSILVKTILQQ